MSFGYILGAGSSLIWFWFVVFVVYSQNYDGYVLLNKQIKSHYEAVKTRTVKRMFLGALLFTIGPVVGLWVFMSKTAEYLEPIYFFLFVLTFTGAVLLIHWKISSNQILRNLGKIQLPWK